MTLHSRISEFDYELPAALIAHTPTAQRGHSRLLVVSRATGQISHHQFSELPNLLEPTDTLVLNNTKVIKARLFAKRKTGGKIEIFLQRPLQHQPAQDSQTEWLAMVSPQRALLPGEFLEISDTVQVELLEKSADFSFAKIRFHATQPVWEILQTYGEIPLPPYIKPDAHPNTFEIAYQTVFAEKEGAVAAPTAGLHFTPELLQTLTNRGIQQRAITLHVGHGTFAPVKVEALADHRMHEEYFEIDTDTAQALTRHRHQGHRVVAVGTTVARALESAWDNGVCKSGSAETRLFITPGYRFKAVDALITNFHLPKSTLLVLVSAFAGTQLIRRAYQEAIAHHYRFFSFGDAMLIL